MHDDTADAPAPSRGRPRDLRRDEAILQAALALLTEVGYHRLSVESIASRAGVGKATVYRRWPNKAAIVAAAADRRVGGEPPQTRGATLRGALLEIVRWLAHEIAEQDMALLAALLTGMRSDPELAAAMRDRLRRDEAEMIAQTLGRAGELDEALSAHAEELFAEVAPAVILHRLVIVGESCDDAFLEHVVDDVLLPLLRRG